MVVVEVVVVELEVVVVVLEVAVDAVDQEADAKHRCAICDSIWIDVSAYCNFSITVM